MQFIELFLVGVVTANIKLKEVKHELRGSSYLRSNVNFAFVIKLLEDLVALGEVFSSVSAGIGFAFFVHLYLF